MLSIFFLNHLLLPLPQGAKKSIQGDDAGWTDNKALWVAACCAGGCALIAAALAPFLQKYTIKKFSHLRAEGDDAQLAEKGYAARTMEPSFNVKDGQKIADELNPEAYVAKEGLEKGDIEDSSQDNLSPEERAE